MSIRVKQEICLNVAKIRCVASLCTGRFVLRFHIFEQNKNSQKMAVPVSVIQSSSSANPQYQLNDNSYATKPFIMRTSGEIPIGELCIFKNDIDIFKYDPDFHEVVLTLVCELMQVDSQRERIVGTFQGKIRGDTVNDSMVIDFHEYGACQVVGSIHSCVYQFSYNSSNEKIHNFQAYCETQTKQYVESLLDYLLQESKKSGQNIRLYLETLQYLENESMTSSIISVSKEQPISPDKKRKRPTLCSLQDNFQSLMGQIKQIGIEQKNMSFVEQYSNRPTEADEPPSKNGQKFGELKRKRKRIFLQKRESQGSSKVTIDEFQRIIHENALKIYEAWRKVLNLLLESQGCLMLDAYYYEYQQRYEKLLKQSVVSFKGSWDIDFYSNEETQRNKMALQIRSQSKQNQKQTNQFKFYNQQFFKGSFPIFFQETVPIQGEQPDWKESFEKNKKWKLGQLQKSQEEEKYMVILVHGLGACRIDMERLKIQLKRQYPANIHIMISSCNQSRTEGDIDNMGIRLANQIQHELAKIDFKPKICLIGHSMGGIIIRSALPRLEKFSSLFYSFTSLSSPHVGYNYSSSKLVDVGLWMINYWKKCQSIMQLTMADSQNIEECLLFQLSKKKGLEWFKKVTFIGSHQDLYVPYYSARVQKHQQCIVDQRNKVNKALIHTEMIDNILNRVKGEIHRIDVNFSIPEQNLDNLIGRAAHINFVSNLETLKILCMVASTIIF